MEKQKQGQEKMESIRQWYDRTTSKARQTLMWACALSLVGGACFFAFAPLKLAQFMQTANGAVTIPIAGGIWIAAFVYIFLVPSREVGFRSQESIEQTTKILEDAVEKQIKPALAVWNRIGARIEVELNAGLMTQIKDTIKNLQDATAKVTHSAESSNGEIKKFTEDAKKFGEESRPAIEALKNLNDRIDKSLGGDFVDNLKAALESVKHMSLPPPDVSGPVKELKVDKALSMISKKPTPKPVIPPPPLAREEAPTPVPAITTNPVAIPAVVPPSPVVAPVPTSGTPVVVPSSTPVMVPTQIMQSAVPVMTQPVAQAPSLTPTPSSRFSPAPPPSPVMGGGAPTPAPIGMGQAPIQVVLPPSPLQRAPEVSAPRPMPPPRQDRPPRPGEVELTLTQKSKPVIVTPVAPQQMGVAVQGGPVPMVMAPQVIERAQG